MAFVMIPFTIFAIDFAIILPQAPNIKHQIAPCYIGVVLICIGQCPADPAGNTWIPGNLAQPTKKSAGMATNTALGNAGDVAGSYVFLDSEKLR